MSRAPNSNDPMAILAATAQALVDQYESQQITLQQYKDSMNSQVVPQVSGLDKSSHNDNAWHTISYAVALVDSVE
jgi:hypothetical protein